MKLRDLFNILLNTAKEHNLSTPELCGGSPRDKVLGILSKSKDIDLDLCTGDKTIHNLATEFGAELRKNYSIKQTHGDDGHISIFIGKQKLDFSSNFNAPNIDKLLVAKGISKPTDMQREMFSRDFTCNALLLTLDLKTIKDPTNLGLEDINKKILKTCLGPENTLRVNTNRIIRVVYLACKLGFNVSPDIIEWVTKNKELVRLSSDHYLTKNIEKAMSKDPDKAIWLINKMNLWDVVPIVKSLVPYHKKANITKLITKEARKSDDLILLKNNIGKYIHFSNSDRLGINYGGGLHPGNPKAVYGFPLTASKYQRIEEGKPDAFYDYGYHKYIYIFDVTGNILDMDNPNLPELAKKMKTFVNANYPKGSWHANYVPAPGPYTKAGAEFLRWVGTIAKDAFKDEHSGINVLLRGIGYDALETRNYGFGDDIGSEIAVLNPSAVSLITKISNPMITKEHLKQIDWYASPEYAKQEEERNKLKQEKYDIEEARLIVLQKYNKEYNDMYDLERKLLKEKKFDEAESIRKDFKEKWKDLIKTAQLKRNFDLGEGLYSNLDKYKSVGDFRKKRRGKRKKIIKKIIDMKKLAYNDFQTSDLFQGGLGPFNDVSIPGIMDDFADKTNSAERLEDHERDGTEFKEFGEFNKNDKTKATSKKLKELLSEEKDGDPTLEPHNYYSSLYGNIAGFEGAATPSPAGDYSTSIMDGPDALTNPWNNSYQSASVKQNKLKK